jgi:hypothetical protein
MLESSKSYTHKIYVGNIGAYPRQTSIIVYSLGITLKNILNAYHYVYIFVLVLGHRIITPRRYKEKVI